MIYLRLKQLSEAEAVKIEAVMKFWKKELTFTSLAVIWSFFFFPCWESE